MAQQPGNEEIYAKVDSTFTTLDTERGEGLKRMQTMHSVKNKILEKEKTRLEQKYGAGHPRVLKINNRIAYNQGAAKDLQTEIQKSEITVPEIDLNTWMVHGRVLNKENQPMQGVTVSLYDNQDHWVRQTGYSCTDARGYYALRYTIKQDQKPDFEADDDLYLTVTDSNHRLLHKETDPVYVSIGHIDYRIVIISGDVCIPPEPVDGPDSGTVPPDAWIVRGRVLYKDDTPGSSLTVSVYDKDLIFDDYLGSTQTDSTGRFQLIYRTEGFHELFEKMPDLYIKVLDNDGNQLYASKGAVRAEAGRVEEFRVVLKEKKPMT
jgi:hypothetical protein